jgi:mannose-6-phosphate isomerase-like protein (cupin superfamily)
MVEATSVNTASRSCFALIATEPPGGGPPLHTHATEDEFFLVLEGEISFWIDGTISRVGEGGTAFVPRGLPHCFKNRSNRSALAPSWEVEVLREHVTRDAFLIPIAIARAAATTEAVVPRAAVVSAVVRSRIVSVEHARSVTSSGARDLASATALTGFLSMRAASAFLKRSSGRLRP